jgi:hypothetical protein
MDGSPLEPEVAVAVADVLGTAAVGSGDDFFDRGGDSLRAARLCSRLAATFAVPVDLRIVFQHPTVAGLAERIATLVAAADVRSAVQAPQRIARNGRVLASPGQQRLWFLNQTTPADYRYHIHLYLRAIGVLDTDAFDRALAGLAARHEVLRSRLVPDGSVLTQVLDAPAPVPVEDVDVTGLPEDERDDAAARLAGVHARRPLDVSVGPILRCLRIRLAADEHLVLLTAHHAAADNLAVSLLLAELTELYAACHAGRAARLAPLELQYADFAAWQQTALPPEEHDRQLAFWLDHLRAVPAPVRRPRAEQQVTADDGEVPFAVPAAVTARLKDLAAEEGATMFMALLAGFALVLADGTGQEGTLVGVHTTGRPHPAFEAVIGYFGNLLPLYVACAGCDTFRELLRRTRDLTVDALRNADLPFETLVRSLRSNRTGATAPLVDIGLSYEDGPLLPVVQDDVTFAPEPPPVRTAKFDLELAAGVVRDALSGAFFFREPHQEADIEDLTGRLAALLAVVADHPDRPLATMRAARGRHEPPVVPHRPPGNATEGRLCQLWRELMARPVVGVDDDFFDLGGHSLLGVSVQAGVAERFGVSIPVRWCFDTPTVAGLAAAVTALRATRPDPAQQELLAKLGWGRDD